MAHGFTQTGRVWGTMDQNLARDHELLLVDLPGHGGSSAVAAGLVDGAVLLAEIGGHGAYLGYSMGARFCLQLALDFADLVDSLVLISGTAGIDQREERAARRAADDALADRLDPPGGTPGMPVERFIHEWLAGPLFAGIPAEAAGIDDRLRNSGAGLASSLRRAGTGAQLPTWARLPELTMPVLVVTGELDGKFTELGRRLVGSIGNNARQVVVAGAGHAPHLQQPDLVADLVRRHLGGDPP